VEPTGHLYAFDLVSGRVAWKLPSPGGVSAQVLGQDGRLFAQAASGEVWAIEASTGRRVWLHRSVGPGAAGWRQVDPVLAGERLVVGWPSGDIEALDAGTGQLLWRVSLGKTPNTSVVAVGDNILVGTLDGRLHRLALADGRALTPLELGGMPFGDLVNAARCVLVLTAKDGYSLSCLDAARGTSVWKRTFPSELTTFRPLLLGDVVVVGYKGQLVGLGMDDGVDAWSCPVDGVPRGLNADKERLYVGTLSGLVTALPLAACQREPGPTGGDSAAKPGEGVRAIAKNTEN
jgi:outer membrane protein assembly factor BamB